MLLSRAFVLSFACAAAAAAGAASAAPLAAQTHTTCPPPRTALVLSGGAANGLAHIGVLRAIDEIGIHLDMIVASSMGAVVGGMYASGYSAIRLDSMVRETPLQELFGTGNPVPRPLGEWPRLLLLRRGPQGLGPQLPFVNERGLNLLLSELLLAGNLAARGDFDALPIPFRAVATDLARRQPIPLGTGDLALAVRASLSIPIIFPPVRIDGTWIGDGGLTANIPVGYARELGAERVIVSDATMHFDESLDLYGVSDMAKLLLSLIMMQKQDTLGPVDVLIRPAVEGYGKLDFSPRARAERIERGYRAGLEALRGEACPSPTADGNRDAPAVRDSGSVTLDGHGDPDGRRVERALGLARGTAVDVNAVGAALRDVAANDPRYDAIWLYPRDAAGGVTLAPRVVQAPRVLLAAGAVWDHEVGFRGWAGIADRGLLDWHLAVTLRATAGRLRQEFDVDARTPGAGATAAVLSAAVANESVRRFTAGGDVIDALDSRQASLAFGPELDIGRGWIAAAGAGYRAWHDTATTHSALGIGARLARTSRFPALTGRADVEWATSYTRVSLALTRPFELRRFRLAPHLRYGWGRGLPLQLQFALGGNDAFPGLHLGERRGDHEAMVGIGVSHALIGPLRLCSDFDAGLAGFGGGVLPRGTWLTGARAGIAFDAPTGTVRIKYGRTTGGRSAFFARIGRWF